jgi:hypothetical protein
MGAQTAAEYQTKADEFLGGQRGKDTLECSRKDGALLRYNPVTGEFGVLANGVIKTYFKPFLRQPARAAQYYRDQCNQ